MKYTHIIFVVYISVFIICILNGHVANSQKKQESKSDKKSDMPKNMNRTVNKTQEQELMLKQLQEMRKIPPMPLITYAPYIFEGVDYDQLPEEIYATYDDCYAEHVRCIRNRVYFHAVCAYHLLRGWMDYIYQCQIELRNCRHRVYSNKTKYGTSMQDDILYFNGESYKCLKHMRRQNDEEDHIEDISNDFEKVTLHYDSAT